MTNDSKSVSLVFMRDTANLTPKMTNMERKWILKKDLIIPKGTEFNNIPLYQTTSYGEDNFEAIVADGKDEIISVVMTEESLKRAVLSLCDNCIFKIPTCLGDPKFGTGVGSDNVYECDEYIGNGSKYEEGWFI